MTRTFGLKTMSLSVTLVTLDPTTKQIADTDEYPQDGSDLAGMEVWRNTVYGSDAVISRGATFLPQLAVTDLMVDGDDLDSFRSEIEMLIGDLDDLCQDLNHQNSEALGFRLNNILKAIKTAAKEGKAVWLS